MKSLVLTTLLAATRYIKIIKPFYDIKWKYALAFYVLEMSWILGSAIRENVMVRYSDFSRSAVCTMYIWDIYIVLAERDRILNVENKIFKYDNSLLDKFQSH